MKIRFAVMLTAVLMLFGASVHGASVTEFGADGSDTASDNRAFSYAFVLSRDEVITVPDGTYYVNTLNIPKGRTLKAENGANPVIRTLDGAEENFITLNTGSVIDGITLVNDHSVKKGISSVYGTNVLIKNCTVDNFTEYGVFGDHSDGFVCDGVKVRNSQNGIHTVYASDVTVKNCYVKNTSTHGIWFWNNDGGTKVGGRIVYDNNTVMDAVGGIWGTGASVVEIRNCTVDNCSDVGIDFEYCDNGIICDNYVSRCQYAGISLFYTCKNIVIRDNIVFNNHRQPHYQDDCAGIKLMAESSDTDYDTGHDNVRIYNNTIYNSPDSYGRRGIFVSTGKKTPRKVYIYGNSVLGNNRKYYINGGAVSYNSFVFECDGSNNNVYVYGEDTGDKSYKSVGKCDGNGVIKASGTGTYRVDFTLDKTSFNTVLNIAGITSVKASSAVKNGKVYSVYFDMSGYKDTEFTVENGTASEIELFKADIDFYKVLSVEDGAEYICNSYYPVYSGLILKRQRSGEYFSIWGDIDSSIRREIK